jgi:DHA1 family tetracycline resistance protein-like MFS transporter
MKKGQLLLPLYFVIFFGFIGYAVMITIFTPLFMEKEYLLLDPTTSDAKRMILLGVTLFLYPFGQFLSSPVLGALSDHYGRRKVLIYSLLFTTLCYVVITYAITENILPLLMVMLFLAGLSEGNITIAQSAIADCTTNTERSRYFGYIYLSASLSFIVGPLLSGKLSDPKVVPWFNPSVPFWGVCILMALTTLWIFTSFKETLTRTKKDGSGHYLDAFINIKHIFTSRFRLLFFTNFCLYLAVFGFFRSYPIYLVDEFNMTLPRLSDFIAWVSVPIILVNMGMFSYFFKKFTNWQMTFYSALLLALSLFVVVIPRSEHSLWLTLFISGFFIATGLPACAAMLSNTAASHEQGAVMGNNQSLQFLAEASSGLVAGLIAAIFVKLTLIILAIFSLIAAFLLLFHPEKKKSH